MISVTIIFNENELDLPVTHLESKEPYHNNLIMRICEAYEIDIDKNNYVDDLVKQNHIIITSTNNALLCYIQCSITEKQWESLKDLKEYFSKFQGFYGSIMQESPIQFFKEGQIDPTVEQFLEYIKDFCISKTR